MVSVSMPLDERHRIYRRRYFSSFKIEEAPVTQLEKNKKKKNEKRGSLQTLLAGGENTANVIQYEGPGSRRFSSIPLRK